MAKPGQPPEGMAAEPTATTVVDQKPKRRVTRKAGENALAIGAAALGVVHTMAEVPKKTVETRKESVDEPRAKTPEGSPHPDWKHNPVGEIVSETVFHDESTTGGVQDDFVSLFKDVFEAPVGTFFYFDSTGKVLLTVTETEPLRQIRESVEALQKEAEKPNADVDKLQLQIDELIEEKQRLLQPWHNANRASIGGKVVAPEDFRAWGYPFVASPTIPGTRSEMGASTIIKVVTERLRERVNSGSTKPKYFNGESRTMYDAITEIAKAYDIPRAIVLGIGANESGYNRFAVSKKKARGVFQIKAAAFADAKAYIEKHPELGSSLRSGPIVGSFAGDTLDNRLVSAELCCAYYVQTREWLNKDVSALEDRLRSIDPSFPAGSMLTIATINGYNAGVGNIKICIERFASLSNGEIRARLGEPPYGADAWLGVIALSFGVANAKGEIAIGPDAFMYPQKILAMGSLIMDEENALSAVDRARDVNVIPLPSLPEIPDVPTRRGLWGTLVKATGVMAAAAGFASFADTTRDRQSRESGPSMTRRDALKLGAASFGMVSPIVRKGREWLEGEAPEPDEPIEPVDAVERDAMRTIDALNADLLARGGGYEWTPSEKSVVYAYGAPANQELLRDDLADMLGDDLVARIKAASGRERKKLFAEALTKQREYVRREIAAGNLVPIPTGPDSQVFCEQVGTASGLENDPDALYFRKEYLKVVPRMIELINYQIDAFNANPAIYGIHDADFPLIPHVASVKISSALRYTSVTGDLFATGRGSNTSKSGISPHWLGAAVDFLALTTPGAHVATFADDLRETKDGPVALAKGERLPNAGFGTRIRDILTKMAGRALFAMREPMLRLEGIEIQPLREERSASSSKLWHVAVKTVEAKP